MSPHIPIAIGCCAAFGIGLAIYHNNDAVRNQFDSKVDDIKCTLQDIKFGIKEVMDKRKARIRSHEQQQQQDHSVPPVYASEKESSHNKIFEYSDPETQSIDEKDHYTNRRDSSVFHDDPEDDIWIISDGGVNQQSQRNNRNDIVGEAARSSAINNVRADDGINLRHLHNDSLGRSWHEIEDDLTSTNSETTNSETTASSYGFVEHEENPQFFVPRRNLPGSLTN
ncbi:hypothetical protein DASC09_023160 [Saccharomycopsis crataegensis]|uniref:Uncharacterized protein n=1 Tax=Saccharomycopsis crataegensis TaxID=43959 RepID=A0AAV5QJY0_9ASCO|nr:hypothetical protein DASC09_023160 [Saccharomycopsis crataegensis]